MKENKIVAKPDVKGDIEWAIYTKGHSVKSFSEEVLNVRDYHIGRVIAGKNNPSPELAKEICDKLGFKFNEIWTVDTDTVHRHKKKVHLLEDDNAVACHSNMEKYNLETTTDMEEVTCKKCLMMIESEVV